MKLARLVAVLILASAWPASATVVDFTTMTVSAEHTLVIDGLTITGSNLSIVEGKGLGSSYALLDGSLDRILRHTDDYPPPPWDGPIPAADGEISLAVDGEITSFTVLPYFTVLSGPNISPDFWISYYPSRRGLTSVLEYPLVTPGTPTTFTFDDFGVGAPLPYQISTIAVYADFGYDPILTGYATPDTPLIVQLGFSVLSVEYTPRTVPEPTTVMLLAVGASCCVLKRRALNGGVL